LAFGIGFQFWAAPVSKLLYIALVWGLYWFAIVVYVVCMAAKVN